MRPQTPQNESRQHNYALLRPMEGLAALSRSCQSKWRPSPAAPFLAEGGQGSD